MSFTTVIPEPRTLRPLPHAIIPEHPGYDEARLAWNLAADQRPAAVIVATSVDDVVGAIKLAQAFGLRVAPQSTGHLASALPDLDDTILLKTHIGGVAVDPDARVARVGAGAIWQDVVDAVTPYGLAALSGSAHDVGVVGYTLGGGMSWLGRKFGASASNVRAIELVTADGVRRRVDATHEPELFWALRGGGGNFGVVTHIEIDLFAVTEVFGGMTIWPISEVRTILEAWAQWSLTAPDVATTSWRILRLPALPEIPEPLRDTPLVVVDGAVLADAAEAATILAPFRALGTPIVDTWETMSPSGLLQIHMDPPAPVPAIADTAQLGELDAAAIDALLAAVRPEEVSPLLAVELRQLGAALSVAAPGAGARSQFDGAFALFAVGVPMSPDHADALDARLDALLAATRPWQLETVYASWAERGGVMTDTFDGETAARLRAIRSHWDPAELFVASHRIPT